METYYVLHKGHNGLQQQDLYPFLKLSIVSDKY